MKLKRGKGLDLELEGRNYKVILMPSRRSYLGMIRKYTLKGKKMSGRNGRAQYTPLIVRKPDHFSGVIHFNAQDITPEIIAHECMHLCYHHLQRPTIKYGKHKSDTEERYCTITGELIGEVTKWINSYL